MGTLCFSTGQYTVTGSVGELQLIYPSLIEHSILHDDFGIKGTEGTVLVISVQNVSEQWPQLVISQRFEPGPDSGFNPGLLLIPETHLLFIGAGTRVLAYDLLHNQRLWEDENDCGFWGWKCHKDVVLMAAELELAAWNVQGKKLWSIFVEPPWDYEVHDNRIRLDVMGNVSEFDLNIGP